MAKEGEMPAHLDGSVQAQVFDARQLAPKDVELLTKEEHFNPQAMLRLSS